MKTVHWLILTGIQSATVLTLSLALTRSPAAKPGSPEPAPSSADADRGPAPNALIDSRQPSDGRREPGPEEGAGLRPFHWNQVESSDYAEYVRNLRGIGCPEATIRDILRADLGGVCAARRRERLDREAVRFWESDYSPAAGAAQEEQVLEEEQEHALARLLGEPSRDFSPSPLSLGPGLAELREPIEACWARHSEDLLRWSASVGSEEPGSVALDRLAELERRHQQEFDALFTPEQREEFDLRHSATAAELREQLDGISVDEGEFRALFGALKDHERIVEEATGQPESAWLSWEHYQTRARAILGEERGSAFSSSDGVEVAAAAPE